MRGPVAPRDPEKKRQFFYLMKDKNVFAAPLQDGRGITPIYLDGGRLIEASKFVGNLSDEKLIDMLKTAEGFKKLVHSMGVIVDGCDRDTKCKFVFQFYGKNDILGGGTLLEMPVRCDGSEHLLDLSQIELTDEDKEVGQLRYEFDENGFTANVTVKMYLNDGFDAPAQEEDAPCDLTSDEFSKHIKDSIVQIGNTYRFNKAVEKARRGEDTTIAFIGGSITQGAGAVPINTECYAYKTYQAFKKITGMDENIHYVKAGVGGTPSELGMIRYDRDVRRGGEVEPDVVIVEFAVNDEGDETKGVCFESLIRKIWNGKSHPAVIILFSVFANDYNLEDRLSPVGRAYALPMVSLKKCVTEQFYKTKDTGRLITKAQYFYDVFHPTNTGHSVMAMCLEQLMRDMKEIVCMEDTDFDKVVSPIGTDFDSVMLLDSKDMPVEAVIDKGDFDSVDTELQAVEMNLDIKGTPEFPYNWRFDATKHDSFTKPFTIELMARRLLIVNKDSGSPNEGIADIYVDGEYVRSINPLDNGWVHCNPLIILNDTECKKRKVEVRMAKGSENKSFTILGFGVCV
ncbi:MAG: SGNH/GDSL hydrolase family protein [Butyrivibrio sp.]|uniref:SGNH/GDSL hydrolase family protein n=1 Tax=Butyrivibrio sp. TaxID=28121 RepID=UPI0025CFB468|nr:SGNH/GDSL hydrolase family protein [Butyrivibrio sp.]MCR5770365.1 SGNH/GDSL hydrolase family protein [Butyrivibrio sp.]